MNNLYSDYEELPQELLTYEGSDKLAEGLITLVNPNSIIDLLRSGYSEERAIPFAITAFGDILVWEKGKYVNCVSFPRHSVTVISSGFDFFFEDIKDVKFLNQHFNFQLYSCAKEKLGSCHDDECYISSPLPAISGELYIDNLSIGKIREYNALCTDMLGVL